jgi:hypothetical protein
MRDGLRIAGHSHQLDLNQIQEGHNWKLGAFNEIGLVEITIPGSAEYFDERCFFLLEITFLR